MLLKGVYSRIKKDGSISYRSSITYKNKHISLGSYPTEKTAHIAYQEAANILFNEKYSINDYNDTFTLYFDKWVILHNFRDNGYYFKTPIYMYKYYFSYFLDRNTTLLFDVDDLFYYSHHKILKRNGYIFVNDYGMQINILSRYGIKNFAVEGKDYNFKDGNPHNFRYHNINIINKYHGVEKSHQKNKDIYIAKINLNGYYIIGKYNSDTIAAIAYNKAADFVNDNNICNRNFPRNYINELDETTYKQLYKNIKISKKIVKLSLLFTEEK